MLLQEYNRVDGYPGRVFQDVQCNSASAGFHFIHSTEIKVNLFKERKLLKLTFSLTKMYFRELVVANGRLLLQIDFLVGFIRMILLLEFIEKNTFEQEKMINIY